MVLPKNAEWIYRKTKEEDENPNLMALIKDVEKALGFKLFYWQKTYIFNQEYRQSGRTTAEVLRELLLITDKPIDYINTPSSPSERYRRAETFRIKKILDDAGVKTRKILTKEQKKLEIPHLPAPRKCKVLGCTAIFHQWIAAEDGQTYALIEYPNGNVSCALPKDIVFTDSTEFIKKNFEEDN